MHARSKVLAVESITVMLFMVLFALVTFLVITAGSNAYNTIIDDKETTQSARTAYSYISMKIKQNDAAGCIDVVDTAFGSTLQIDTDGGQYRTYIFYADGTLYECLTRADDAPAVSAANKITAIDGFSLKKHGALITVCCECTHGKAAQTVEGTVALRT